jgi:hypothetical protein
MTPSAESVIFLIIGGTLTQIVNKLLNSRSDKLQEHLSLRKELREELDAVRCQVVEMQTELDTWRERYYEQLELTSKLSIDVKRLTEELAEYKQISGGHHIATLETLNTTL